VDDVVGPDPDGGGEKADVTPRSLRELEGAAVVGHCRRRRVALRADGAEPPQGAEVDLGGVPRGPLRHGRCELQGPVEEADRLDVGSRSLGRRGGEHVVRDRLLDAVGGVEMLSHDGGVGVLTLAEGAGHREMSASAVVEELLGVVRRVPHQRMDEPVRHRAFGRRQLLQDRRPDQRGQARRHLAAGEAGGGAQHPDVDLAPDRRRQLGQAPVLPQRVEARGQEVPNRRGDGARLRPRVAADGPHQLIGEERVAVTAVGDVFPQALGDGVDVRQLADELTVVGGWEPLDVDGERALSAPWGPEVGAARREDE
jgi:hypothetical protein